VIGNEVAEFAFAVKLLPGRSDSMSDRERTTLVCSELSTQLAGRMAERGADTRRGSEPAVLPAEWEGLDRGAVCITVCSPLGQEIVDVVRSRTGERRADIVSALVAAGLSAAAEQEGNGSAAWTRRIQEPGNRGYSRGPGQRPTAPRSPADLPRPDWTPRPATATMAERQQVDAGRDAGAR